MRYKFSNLFKFLTLGFLYIFFTINVIQAQYPPQVGFPGCDAIHYQDTSIKGWATDCALKLGRINITDTTSDFASNGTKEDALGPALSNGIVSLGDGGSANLTFKYAIINGPGPDFAVFENGIPTKDSLAFLELAFVEVSSDGINFVRFPAYSMNDTSKQFNGFYEINARYIKNLAGKYIGGYGVPFDLEDIKDSPNINTDRITHIRVIDVIGSLDKKYASYDVNGRAVNDPYPTPFPSSGFDLDAVGVIHQSNEVGINEDHNKLNYIHIYPNPTTGYINCMVEETGIIRILDVAGNTVMQSVIIGNKYFKQDLSPYPTGLYFVNITTNRGQQITKIMKQ